MFPSGQRCFMYFRDQVAERQKIMGFVFYKRVWK